MGLDPLRVQHLSDGGRFLGNLNANRITMLGERVRTSSATLFGTPRLRIPYCSDTLERVIRRAHYARATRNEEKWVHRDKMERYRLGGTPVISTSAREE